MKKQHEEVRDCFRGQYGDLRCGNSVQLRTGSEIVFLIRLKLCAVRLAQLGCNGGDKKWIYHKLLPRAAHAQRRG